MLVLNFWATWCPPCRAELPYLEGFFQDYNAEVKFLLVSNEEKEVVKAFFAKEEIVLPNYQSISRPPSYFLETNSIPASYILDKQGRIAVEKTGAAPSTVTEPRSPDAAPAAPPAASAIVPENELTCRSLESVSPSAIVVLKTRSVLPVPL